MQAVVTWCGCTRTSPTTPRLSQCSTRCEPRAWRTRQPSQETLPLTLAEALAQVLENYNMVNKVMNLVLFDDCLDHLVRVHRLMRLPRGNALLVGVGGSGKQSITRLAAYTAGADVFTITLTRGYNEQLFREDLKTLYGSLADKPVAFFFSDAHVAEEGFLELVNNMLTSGMVPALYA